MTNVTREEFERIVRQSYPHKYFYIDFGQLGSPCLFALDTYGESQKSFPDKYSIASHIWMAHQNNAYATADSVGDVIKDTTGIFPYNPTIVTTTSHNPVRTITFPNAITVPAGYSYKFQYSDTHGGLYGNKPMEQLRKAKCECGAHSVNSNIHSDWCDLKELA